MRTRKPVSKKAKSLAAKTVPARKARNVKGGFPVTKKMDATSPSLILDGHSGAHVK